MLRCIFLMLFIGLNFFAGAQNVGIGTNTPAAKLDVVGTIKISDGTQGANKVLTSGPDGQASWANPPAPSFMAFAADQSVSNGHFVGVGANSYTFSRNSIVMPFNCELTSITFSIRSFISYQNITATVWKQTPVGAPMATSLQVVIPNGASALFATSFGSLQVQQGDALSIKINWPDVGALIDGASITVTYR